MEEINWIIAIFLESNCWTYLFEIKETMVMEVTTTPIPIEYTINLSITINNELSYIDSVSTNKKAGNVQLNDVIP
ncbi:hypothetical protein QI284_12780 [Staphylococcus saprophyticus]|nr:hypothetical protein [Staphylococcus saprophyticus]